MKYQRIEELRVDHDLTQKQVAAELGCNRGVYTRYELASEKSQSGL